MYRDRPSGNGQLSITSTGMFGLCKCNGFGDPAKRLLGGVTGLYGSLGSFLGRYLARMGGLERPFLKFKREGGLQKNMGCVLLPLWLNSVSSTD